MESANGQKLVLAYKLIARSSIQRLRVTGSRYAGQGSRPFYDDPEPEAPDAFVPEPVPDGFVDVEPYPDAAVEPDGAPLPDPEPDAVPLPE